MLVNVYKLIKLHSLRIKVSNEPELNKWARVCSALRVSDMEVLLFCDKRVFYIL